MKAFIIPNMTCQGCAAAITRAVLLSDKDAQIKADPKIHRVEIESSLSAEQLAVLLGAAGYTAQVAS